MTLTRFFCDTDHRDSARIYVAALTPRQQLLAAGDRINSNDSAVIPAVQNIQAHRIDSVGIAHNEIAVRGDSDSHRSHQIASLGDHSLSTELGVYKDDPAVPKVPIWRRHIRKVNIVALNRDSLRVFQEAS